MAFAFFGDLFDERAYLVGFVFNYAVKRDAVTGGFDQFFYDFAAFVVGFGARVADGEYCTGDGVFGLFNVICVRHGELRDENGCDNIINCRGDPLWSPDSSRQTHGAEVVVADFEAVEGVAVVAAVLFDDVPARAGFAPGFKDGGPVEVAFADFGKARFAAFNGHVFDVDEIYAGVGFADPFGGVASSCLYPVHVDFELYCFGVCFLQDDFKGGAVAVFLKFKVVVVICKGQARVGEFVADFGGVFGKADISGFAVFPIGRGVGCRWRDICSSRGGVRL